MDDALLPAAVVTIRTASGREIDITDDQKERDRRAAAGRVVLSGREVMRLHAAGVRREQAAVLLPMLAAFPGGAVEKVESSAGPYPWDGADVVREVQEEESGEQRKWW